MSQSFPRLIPVVVLAAVAAAAGLIATRTLTGGGGDAGAQAVLDGALGGDQKLKSGKFSANVNVTVQGAPNAQFAGPIGVRMSGAFDESRKGGRPEMALDASMNMGQSVEFGLVTTGSSAFVRFGRTSYAVPRSQLKQFYGQGTPAPDQQVTAALGFDPRGWFKDPTDEGSATVGAVETRHVSAGIDTDRMLDDLLALAQRTQPQGVPQLPGDEIQKARDAIEDARVDLFTGADDGILRKLTVHAGINADDGSGDIDFDLEFSDVNKPQKIIAPARSSPFSQLERDLSSGSFGVLTGGEVAAGGTPSSTAADGSSAAAVPREAQAYLACVQRAGSAAGLRRCSALLP